MKISLIENSNPQIQIKNLNIFTTHSTAPGKSRYFPIAQIHLFCFAATLFAGGAFFSGSRLRFG